MKLQLKHKMLLGMAVPLLLMLLLCGIAINIMNEIDSGVENIYSDRVVPLKDLKSIGDDYAVFVIDAINKANAGDFSAEQASTALNEADRSIKQKWQDYTATQLTARESQLVNEAKRLFIPADEQIKRLQHKLATMSGNIQGQLNQEITPLYQVIDPISGKIAELVTLQLDVAKQEREQAQSLYSSSVVLFISLVSIAIIACLLLSVWVNRSVMLPIGDILTQLKKIRSDSDLTVQFKTFNADELGQISDNLRDVISHLRGILNNIANAANTVSDSATELSSFTQQTNERMHRQQAETEQTATAMNEMTATVSEVAQSTTAAADSAHSADASAANGDAIVQESIASMVALSAQIQGTAQVITHLANESQNIGRVLDVIKGIAEQTNLLALNAAIEAARAGEQGRGFAVVADEVRTLASRTHSSTQEIESMIATLQTGVQEAVTAMEQGITQVEQANSKANMAGEALKEIVVSVDSIAQLNTHIATAAEEQSSVAEDINRSIMAISDITQQSAQAANELTESVSNLSHLAENMRAEVARFRL
ncbi:methyl-accepting chemotaxis protein [Shewanella chilikensis]|uniref:methyl-accepting chemotaxis protein n=1 Tax=Shewanella chilikensis TaxID=558541 RepID=UPI001F466C45|nr:methyl-accepting chemotaxis protein [Shewanella chilikensis]MCE9852049.1 methyl-accepting chemotaxis protein [Shewanella chilikensis]